MAPIHDAAQRLDLAALRRELDAGVSPDLPDDESIMPGIPMHYVIMFCSALDMHSIDHRLACIEALLRAGASVNLISSGISGGGDTALHCAVSLTDRSRYPTNFELVVDRLLRAGADVNAIDDSEFDDYGRSVLAAAALKGTSTTVAKLLSAGAVDPGGFDKPVRCARFRPRICAILMRAGGVLKLDPDPERNGWLEQSHYLRKVYETPGGFPAYEKAHRERLAAIFLPKLPSLPAEIVSHIVSFGFNCGCY